ncbi:hypothetical protein D5R95_08225, partial [Methanosalsum natronophilum]
MKKIAIVLVALMLMSMFAVAIPSSAANDKLEIRGPVWGIGDTGLEANSTNFAGFWYDLNENKSSERLIINSWTGDNKLEDDDLKYYSVPQNVTSEQNFNGFEHYAI